MVWNIDNTRTNKETQERNNLNNGSMATYRNRTSQLHAGSHMTQKPVTQSELKKVINKLEKKLKK